MGPRIKALMGLTAAGIFASALVPSAAHADQEGTSFDFCNVSGNIPYPQDEKVVFPYHDNFESWVEPPDGCWGRLISGVANDEAVGYRYVNGHWLAVATTYFNDYSTPSVEFYF